MRKKVTIIGLVLSCIFLLQNCENMDIIAPIGFETTVQADSITFAVVGDYGLPGEAEKQVANMIKNWNPDFILTTGDNNYNEGKYATIKNNITQYYGDFIYNYDAPSQYQCNGKAFSECINRFFPCPGNHDANNKNKLAPYLNFFTLPGRENYYKIIWGSVSFYSLDTETGNFEQQKAWLFNELDNSQTNFNVVYFHQSPWSPGIHGNFQPMQWDFYHHNVDLILTGHDHLYSRIEKLNEPGMYYIVNGLGGSSLYDINTTNLSTDQFSYYCYNQNYGAIKATANNTQLQMKFYSISDTDHAIDSITIHK